MSRPFPIRPAALLCAAASLALATPARPQRSPGETTTAAFAREWLTLVHPATDDPRATAWGLLDLARRHASSPLAELPILALDDTDLQLEPQALARGLRAFLAGGPHGMPALAARNVLADLDERLGRARDPSLDPSHGHVLTWRAVGPFGNLGDFYLDTPFPPELRFPEPGQTLEGRFGPVTSWTTQPTRSGRAQVDLQDPRTGREGCYYGRAVVAAHEPVSGWLEVRTGSSLRIWIDGQEVGRVDRTRNRPGRRLHFPFRLAAGRHELLVKTGLAAASSFALRFVDPTGHPLDAVGELDPDTATAATAAAVATTAADAPQEPAGRFLDALALLDRSATDRSGLDPVRVAAAGVALEQDADDLGQQLVFALERALPAGREPEAVPVEVLLATARCFERAPDLPTEIRQARARALLDAAFRDAPEHAGVVLKQAALLEQDDDLEGRVRLLASACTSPAAGPNLTLALAAAWTDLGDGGRGSRIRERLLEGDPALHGLRLRLATEQLRASDLAGARALCAAGLQMVPGDPALLDLDRLLAARLGDLDVALALLDRRMRRDLRPTVVLRRRAETLDQAGDATRAAAVWEQLAGHEDVSTDDLETAGAALLRAGRAEAATDALRRVLDREPERHALRRQLAALGGAPTDPVLERFRSPAEEVDAMVADFVAGERERGAASTLLLDRMVTRMLPDGSRVEEVHQLRRINDRNGVEAHEQQTAAARADRVLRLRTILPDGRSVLPKRVAGDYSMPRVEPGCFIEALYVNDHPAPGGGPVRGPEFYFQSADEPFVHSELLLAIPPGLPGSLRTRNLDRGPQPLELGDLGVTVLRLLREDVPRLRAERFAPPLEAQAPYVTYGEDAPAGALPRALRAISSIRARPSPWVDAATAQVCEGLGSDQAKLEAIHRFVHDLVEAERGNPDPTAILLRRQGPRFFLEVAMLESAGIDLEHAGVARRNEDYSSDVPSLFDGEDEYPLPAARVLPADGDPVWLFADAPRHAPPGFVSGERGGAAWLRAADAALGRLPAASPDGIDGWDVRGLAEATPTGELRLQSVSQLRGAAGYGLADQIRELQADRRGLAAQQLGARLFAGWRVAGAQLDPPPPGQRFALQLRLDRTRAVESNGAIRRIPLPMPPSRMQARYGDRPDREQDFVLRAAARDDWEVRLRTPEDWRLAEIPPDLRIRRPGCDYLLRFDLDGDDVVIRRHLQLSTTRYEAADFAAWLTLCARIDRAEAQGLLFRAPE